MTFPFVPPSGNPTGYNLSRSLRIRASANGYLSRTPAVAGNRQKWTYSAWVKRGTLGTSNYQPILGYAISGTLDLIGFNSSNQFVYFSVDGGGGTTRANYNTNAVFRDPSSWYHVVVAIDTTQATAANRLNIYINGVQQTLTTSTAFALNWQTYINNNIQNNIGYGFNAPVDQLDGYLTEVNFIDGQQLTASSFGSTNAQTGVWQPAKYTGSYGTNGFYLPFTDNSALTSGSNAGLGKDFSGNGNYWNTNNISITTGATYDSMTDVPTLTSATAANFATLNPLNAVGSTATFSNANLSLVLPDGSVSRTAFATMGVSSGKYYWEVTVGTTAATYYPGIGVNTNTAASPLNQSGSDATGYMYTITGQKLNNGSLAAYGASYTTNDVIGVALDMDGGTITFYKNNATQGQAYSGLSGTAVPCFIGEVNASLSVNFGQQGFKYTPPTGFVALNTYNLPTPTIGATSSTVANKYFDANLYTGNGTSQTVTNAGGFQPDLVWVKIRSGAGDHYLADVNRGVSTGLYTNATNAEITESGRGITSFNSNGFGLGLDPLLKGSTNLLSATYVGWQWKAGGTPSSNTNGSTTSTVSVNPSSGFSVVTYTGNNTAGSTIGHGLGVTPSMIIFKSRNNATTWPVYHISTGNSAFCVLNTNATSSGLTGSGILNNTTPSSSVITLGNYSGTNQGSYTYVAYCFAPIAGFSAFGSYTGNASTDGPFVYCGFQPKYILTKNTNNLNDWIVFDTVRNTYNALSSYLFPDGNNSEGTASPGYFDAVSNGFKVRTSNQDGNGSGNTIIYAAFATFPFKYSTAR